MLVQGNDGHGWGAKVVTRDTFVECGVIKLKLCDRQSGFPLVPDSSIRLSTKISSRFAAQGSIRGSNELLVL